MSLVVKRISEGWTVGDVDACGIIVEKATTKKIKSNGVEVTKVKKDWAGFIILLPEEVAALGVELRSELPFNVKRGDQIEGSDLFWLEVVEDKK